MNNWRSRLCRSSRRAAPREPRASGFLHGRVCRSVRWLRAPRAPNVQWPRVPRQRQQMVAGGASAASYPLTSVAPKFVPRQRHGNLRPDQGSCGRRNGLARSNAADATRNTENLFPGVARRLAPPATISCRFAAHTQRTPYVIAISGCSSGESAPLLGRFALRRGIDNAVRQRRNQPTTDNAPAPAGAHLLRTRMGREPPPSRIS
jgi:hypothetical protein